MPITKVPEPILRRKLRPTDMAALKRGEFTPLFEEMRSSMVEHNGIGLAANQIGKDVRAFVIDATVARENKVPDVFINPEITEYSDDTDSTEEGCLSIPGYYSQIPRSKKIWIKAYDEHGGRVKFRARGLLARILQHETDHLNGIVITDREKRTKN